jgi:hypothetical protein
MPKLRESKDLTPEQENIFLAVLCLDIQMSQLSDKYNELEKKKEKLLNKTEFAGYALGKYQGWRSINDDAQIIKDLIEK